MSFMGYGILVFAYRYDGRPRGRTVPETECENWRKLVVIVFLACQEF